MQEHRYSFDVDATPEEVWRVMHQRPTEPSSGPVEIGEFGPICRKIEHGPVTIEILHEGDENNAGLVRHCFFRVPKYLLSGGVAQSWEHITEVVPYVSAKYYAIGKPLWSRAEGEHRLEPLPDGTTASTSWSATTSSIRSCVSSSNGASTSSSRRTTTNWFERASSRHWRRRDGSRTCSASPGGHHGRVLLAQVSDAHLLSDPGASAWGQNPAENLASVMHALSPVDAIVATGDIVGAPATFSQLRHGGDPHFTDTGEPPGAQILDLHDDGDFDRHIVLAEA